MNVHKNARLTPRGREVLVSRLKRGKHPGDVGAAMGVSVSTVYKWWWRYREEGRGEFSDRSSRPKASPNKPPDELEAKVIALRKEGRKKIETYRGRCSAAGAACQRRSDRQSPSYRNNFRPAQDLVYSLAPVLWHLQGLAPKDG